MKAGGLKQAELVLVLSNRRDLEPLARRHKLPFVFPSLGGAAQGGASCAESPLDQQAIDFVVLGRFMKILSPNFVGVTKTKLSTSILHCCPVFRAAGLPTGL